jgi:VWFA-related protein
MRTAAVVFAIIGGVSFAQDAPSPTPPRVTGQGEAAGSQILINEVNISQFPRVQIFTTVLKEGAPLKGLTASDFRVREDEVDQGPLTVEPNLPPLSVVLTLDTSGSMRERLSDAKTAAKSFLDNLRSTDSAQIIGFSREVKKLTPMSTSRDSVRKAIDSTTARGDTALYDALFESVVSVQDRPGRKAVVLLSDGVDDDGTGKQLSKHSVAEVLRSAREVNVPIYVIGLGKEIDEALLSNVAQTTGALYFLAPQVSDLATMYSKIGEQLSGQYLISYDSNLPGDGSMHRIQLKYSDLTSTKEYKSPGTAVATAPTALPTEPAGQEAAPGTGLSLGESGLRAQGDGQSVEIDASGIRVNPGSQPAAPADTPAAPADGPLMSTGERPDGFPGWVPMPAGMNIETANVRETNQGVQGFLKYTIRSPHREVANFYRSALKNSGVKPDFNLTTTYGNVSFQAGGRELRVNCRSAAGGVETKVQVTFEEAPAQ